MYEMRFPYNTLGCVSSPSYARVLLCLDCPSLCHGCVCRAPSILLRIKSHSLRSPDSPHTPYTCRGRSQPLLGASSCFSHRMDHIALRDVLILSQSLPLPTIQPRIRTHLLPLRIPGTGHVPGKHAREAFTEQMNEQQKSSACYSALAFKGAVVGQSPQGCISIETVSERTRVSVDTTRGRRNPLQASGGVHALTAASSNRVRNGDAGFCRRRGFGPLAGATA